MILKACNGPEYNVSMWLEVNWMRKEINIGVQGYHKVRSTSTKAWFTADHFAEAIARYEELKLFYKGE